MPEASIRPFLSPSVNWRQLMDVKAKWGVSAAALLRRALDLEVLSQARYTSAMKYMSARGWRQSEPGDRALGSPEEPRLVAAAVRQLGANELDVATIADEAGLPAGDIQNLITPAGKTRYRVEP